jgi:putative salt-induced outer membrane protein YdiY
MTLTRGNSETLRYSAGVNAVKERADDLFRFQAKGAYGQSGDKTDTENAMAALRHEHRLTQTTYALGNLEWMTDAIADLDYRVTSILSPGIHLVRTPLTLFNVELGAGYLAERKGAKEEGYAAGRLAITFERVLNEHVLSWVTAEYLPKITEAQVFYVNSEAGIATALSRSLSLNITIQDRYDNAPVEAKHNHDTVLTTSLSLNF